MKRSLFILDKHHPGDTSLLIAFIYSFLRGLLLADTSIVNIMHSHGVCQLAIWEDIFTGLKSALIWIDPIVLFPGVALGIMGLFAKEQDKRKSIAGLSICSLWLCLWGIICLAQFIFCPIGDFDRPLGR